MSREISNYIMYLVFRSGVMLTTISPSMYMRKLMMKLAHCCQVKINRVNRLLLYKRKQQ